MSPKLTIIINLHSDMTTLLTALSIPRSHKSFSFGFHWCKLVTPIINDPALGQPTLAPKEATREISIRETSINQTLS